MHHEDKSNQLVAPLGIPKCVWLPVQVCERAQMLRVSLGGPAVVE